MAKIIASRVEETVIDHESALLRMLAAVPHASGPSIEEVIDRITNLNSGLRDFWSSAHGWAPVAAAQLLSKSRLDWQVSLSQCLRIWIQESPGEDSQGRLILAWANLGSLVEGTMKLFLSVWYQDYKDDGEHPKLTMDKGKLRCPDSMSFENMRQYFEQCIWDETWDKCVGHVQNRRNTIHAYRNRDIGDHADLLQAIRKYLEFLRYVNARLPYLDEEYVPQETKQEEE